MGASVITSEITEVNDEPNPAYPSKSLTLVTSKPSRNESMGKKHVHPIEDELTQLIEARDPKYLSKTLHLSHSKGIDLFRNSAMKKSSQTFGLGISESVTLKQALRKLCISQASEMAAIKRLSKPTGASGSSEAGTIKRLYAAAVVHGSESVYKEHDKMLEISLLSEKASPKSSGSVSEFSSNLPTEESRDSCTMSSKSSSQVSYATASVPIGESCGSCTLSSKSSSQVSYVTTAVKEFKPKIRDVLCSTSEADEMKLQVRLEPPKKEKIKKSELPVLKSKTGSVSNKSTISPCLVKPTLKNKNSSNKKEGHDKPSLCVKSNKSISSRKASPVFSRIKSASKMGSSPPSASSTTVCKPPLPYLDKEELSEKKPASTPSNYSDDEIGAKRRELSRSREKGECSQSSKSSIGDYSSSTSISDESNQSISSVGIRPHMSNDVRWEAIRHVEMQGRSIALKNFKLLKRLGCGDIGTVYLAELTGLDCLFALKVMDIEFLMNRKKMMRAKAEREILQMLDHPFLPTLYTHFTTDNLSCLVMEYCPGGDLHVLRQKQLGRCFSEPAAKFYVAEVLLALEYLHMLGVVYRDLKPENILVREDGHIMLSDFDLSLRCTVNPALFRLSSVGTVETAARSSGVCAESYCIDPLCLQPSWAQVSCFTPRLTSSVTPKSRKPKSDHSTHVKRLPQLVVEPVEARSNSFVGTHEYLAPEIIKGEGHGSSVDWWTFGIFLYELIFGRTPFKGSNNDETLANVVTQPLKFPENVVVSFNARELIRGLLVKEPENRLGSVRGAAEIKQHPFFTGLNWALIRCATPPEVPKAYDFGIPSTEPTPSPPPPPPKKKEGRCLEFRSNGEGVEFELF